MQSHGGAILGVWKPSSKQWELDFTEAVEDLPEEEGLRISQELANAIGDSFNNLGTHQARKKIIEECQYAERDITLEFIPGFNHGTAIRDFIRNGQLEQSLRDRGINFGLWNNGSGSTYYNRL